MAPSISIREHIRWLPNDASEPTSTLVLTSSQKRFVDIRILKPTGTKITDEVKEGVLLHSRLDWAFAGTSSSEMRQTPTGKATTHSIWHHWVDSHHANAEEVIDEADMYPQTDGRTLEIGRMVNAATGKMTDYEELWKDVEPLVTSSEEAIPKACVVLQLQDDAHKARGMVMRLGQFCQGVLRVGESVNLERWQWYERGGWKRASRIGDYWLPCGVVLDGYQTLALGGEVKHGEYLWEVIEMEEF